ETDIVAMPRIVRAWIAKADEQEHETSLGAGSGTRTTRKVWAGKKRTAASAPAAAAAGAQKQAAAAGGSSAQGPADRRHRERMRFCHHRDGSAGSWIREQAAFRANAFPDRLIPRPRRAPLRPLPPPLRLR